MQKRKNWTWCFIERLFTHEKNVSGAKICELVRGTLYVQHRELVACHTRFEKDRVRFALLSDTIFSPCPFNDKCDLYEHPKFITPFYFMKLIFCT